MKLQEELAEKEALYTQLQQDLKEHFPHGSHLTFAEITEHTQYVSQIYHLETDIHRLREAIYNHNPHDDYWSVIEDCIDHNITPDVLEEIIATWRSLP